MFSNSTSGSIAVDFSSHPLFQENAVLKSEANTLFYGSYPTYCAKISNEEEITKKIRNGHRHVVGIKIKQDEDRIMRRDVVRKIEDIVKQLSKFSINGFFWYKGLQWSKKPGHIIIEFNGEQLIFRIYVCDDSCMFHILANVISSEETMENTEKLNKLIYSVRVVFQDKDALPGFESIVLTPEKWKATYSVTREQSMDFVTFYTNRIVYISFVSDEPSYEPPNKKRRIT